MCASGGHAVVVGSPATSMLSLILKGTPKSGGRACLSRYCSDRLRAALRTRSFGSRWIHTLGSWLWYFSILSYTASATVTGESPDLYAACRSEILKEPSQLGGVCGGVAKWSDSKRGAELARASTSGANSPTKPNKPWLQLIMSRLAVLNAALYPAVA